MRRMAFIVTCALVAAAAGAVAQSGPYKVLKTAKVGGEGGWDYIYADAAGRRLYIPRRGAADAPARPDAADRSSTSTRSSRSAKSTASAATAPRSIRSRATASPAASRSRCSTRRR